MKVVCAKCGEAIPDEDFNVSTDIAYCRKCDFKQSLSELLEADEIDASITYDPPGGTFFQEDFQGFTVGARFSKGFLLFLIPFTCAWSGFSMWGIYIQPFLRGKFDVTIMLFGLPFLFGSIVLCSVVFTALFGSLKIMVKDYDGKIIFGVGGLGWKRRFNVADVDSVSLKTSNVRVNNIPQKGVCISGANMEPITFGTTLKENQKEYVAAVLKQKLISSRG
ncbi:MAG: hypothetical protein GXP32_00875 [Kiritimatiellaeota bacterium]|nr:hypothetical protein [Kiritimatiellota bacterium]